MTYGAGALVILTLLGFLSLALCNNRGPRDQAMEAEQATIDKDRMAPPLQASRDKRQARVAMKSEGGVFVVPVLINGVITLDFLIDSGASDVTIPEDVVVTLIRAKTIRKADFKGQKTYVLADGTEVESHTFNIRSLQVGDRILTNVMGSVTSNKGSLLLGQSFLRRFGSWSIDNRNHELVLE